MNGQQDNQHDYIRVGIFGLGTVGAGLVHLLQEDRDLITKRVGQEIRITKAVVANPDKDRGIDLSGIEISNDPSFILDDPNIDIVVEVVGGLDLAEHIIIEAFRQKKSVITANKAVLAEKTQEIFDAAYASSQFFGFEASVAGGIPIIRTIREGFAGDSILELSGIMNGTANYILSKMTEEGALFSDVLQDAQEKGYAEADPTFDIEGNDTAHKLIILMSLAFNGIFQYKDLYTEGITQIEPLDIQYADELGYKIKLLGKAKRTPKGIEARVHPTLIPKTKMLSAVSDSFNAIELLGKFVGDSLLYGRGAGSHPTASAILSDLVEASRSLVVGEVSPLYPLSTGKEHLEKLPILPMEEVETPYYLRFTVYDHVGVLSKITTTFVDHNINIQSVIQKTQAHSGDTPIHLVIETHRANEASVQKALQKINQLDFVASQTRLIRMDVME